jgi:site-specific DNA-methyltransferase (adenine-specific)/modification methylase
MDWGGGGVTPYYDDGQITIYHADCRDVLPTLDPSSVDLVLTDPPYGVAERTARLTNGRSNATASLDFLPVAGDDEVFDPSPLLAFRRVMIFGANHFAHRLPPSPTWIVWDKRDGTTADDNADCELIWSNVGGPARLYRHLWRGMIKASERDERRVHPTQKPVALMRWILDKWSKPGDLILDPYMGSGPIARACADLGRRYIGIEIDQKYVDVAVRRLQQAVLPLEIPA